MPAAHPDSVSTVREELPLGRLEALSDGVFAIAITVLVLELALEPDAADDALRAILDEWPSYLAYVTSFLTIGVVWMAHSTITGHLRAADGTLYRLNLLVLLLASFLPFPTKLVSEFIEEDEAERVAVVFYGLTLLALVMALTFFIRYAFERPELLTEHVGAETAGRARQYRPSYILYLIAIAVGLLLPLVAVALYLVIALYAAVPARTIRRLARLGRGGPPIPERDRDRRSDDDRRDDVRHDEDETRGGDAVREPEQEADEQDREVSDRHTARASVLDDLADLEHGTERHRDRPRGCDDAEGGFHVVSSRTVTGLARGESVLGSTIRGHEHAPRF
jgi:uncharacterized membrane protein